MGCGGAKQVAVIEPDTRPNVQITTGKSVEDVKVNQPVTTQSNVNTTSTKTEPLRSTMQSNNEPTVCNIIEFWLH